METQERMFADNSDLEAVTADTIVVTEDEASKMTLEDTLSIVQLLREHGARSVADGWEARARDVQPGRGYAFVEQNQRDMDIRRGIGVYAVGIRHDAGQQSFGMPEHQRPGVGQFARRFGRHAIARY